MTVVADQDTVRKDSTGRDQDRQDHQARRRYMPLLYRAAGINAVLVVAAVAVTIAVLAPGKVSSLALDEELLVLVLAVILVALANVYLLQRVVGPVQALTALARQVDFANLGQRMPGAARSSEAGELALTFNEMLSRLESEHRDSAGRVLRAQESERLRIAQELHDQVGQELTVVLLGLERISSRASPALGEDVIVVQDAVRKSLDDVRRIAIELRPEALDDLGLATALTVLTERFSEQLGLEISDRIAPDLPALPEEAELVVYRVAQEALTNVARHSASSRVDLTLEHADGRLILTVRDYGLGLPQHVTDGTGMRGMRERATLIGATIEIGAHRGGPGCEVALEVPVEG
jgi:two-component system sensor histidine kinase UhpB